MNILIVDDDVLLVNELSSMLKKEGYNIYSSFSACTTLEVLKQHSIDIALLDVNLGEDNGIELLKFFKAGDKIYKPFVVLISGMEMDSNFIEEALRLGADAFISKPIYEENLKSRIKVLARLKTQEKELIKAQKRLEIIIESSIDGLIVMNKSGMIVFANKSSEQVFGKSRENLIGKILTIPLKDDYITEAEVVRADGKERYAEIRFTAINWDNEDMFLATVRDITEMHRIQEKLNQSEIFYRRLTEKNNEGILLLDRFANIQGCPTGSTIMFDSGRKDLTGINFMEFVHKDFHLTFKEDYAEILGSHGTVKKFIWKYITESYKERWFEGHIQNLLDDPVFNAVLINFRDISELLLSKEELQKKANETELIYNAGKKLSQSLDLNDIFDKFYEIVSGIMDVNDMVITSYIKETGELQFDCIWDDRVKQEIGGYPRIKFDNSGKGVQSRVIINNRAYLINDYPEAIKASNSVFVSGKGIMHPSELNYGEKGARSAIVCPLHVKEKVTGVLQIFSYKFNTYSETDLRILQAISNSLAMAMINAKLYENIQKELTERKRVEHELTLSEERFNAFMKFLPAKAWVTDREHKILFSNSTGSNYKSSGIVGKKIQDVEEQKLAEEYISNSNKVFDTKKPLEVIEHSYRSDGTMGSFLSNKFPIFSDSGELLMGGIAIDITDRLKQEEELKGALNEIASAEHRFKEFMEHIPALTWITDKNHNVLYSNKIEYKINSKNTGSIIGKNIKDLFEEDNYTNYITTSNKVLATGVGCQVIEKVDRLDGTVGDYLVYKFPLKSPTGELMLGAIAIDLTDRLEMEDKLKSTINEKETVLKEIHHRVKNNLQIINSLLSMQSNTVNNEKTSELLKLAQNRVRSMALIHEQLYNTDTLSRINFESYAIQLVNHLFSAYEGYRKNITHVINCNNIELDIETAIPMGLIMNELVSNSLKYAFEGRSEGTIEISLEKIDNVELMLTIKDNGTGLPEGFDISKLNTMGLSLVEMLVYQLDGNYDIENENGTCFRITIEKPYYKQRLKSGTASYQ